MWSFYNSKDRLFADTVFKEIIKVSTSEKYNSKKNQKGRDQIFLSDFLYNKVRSRALIHDSYLCMHYHDSVPFPTRRKGACFIGRSGHSHNNNCENMSMPACPRECRPKDHQDWISC